SRAIKMKRRDLLLGAPTLLAGACASQAEPTRSPFVFGVASGDPTATSIVLWTGLAQYLSAPLRWRLRRGGEPVAEGIASVAASGAAKALVEGLEPDQNYDYDFICGPWISPQGRARTLPTAGKRPIRLAVFSCSRYSSGWFHAYRHAAQDQ